MNKTSSIRLGEGREAADLTSDAARHPARRRTSQPRPESHVRTARRSAATVRHAGRRHRAVSPLSSLAVAGLVLGLLSALAVLGPLLWIIPAAGAVTSGVALWRIGRPAALMAGRRLAQCGLLLSIMFGTMVQADGARLSLPGSQGSPAVRRHCGSAISCARPPQPQKAYQLTLPPRFRQPLDEQLGDFYRRNPHRRESLDDYLKTPLVRKLLALGPGGRPPLLRGQRAPGLQRRQRRGRTHLCRRRPGPGRTRQRRSWSSWDSRTSNSTAAGPIGDCSTRKLRMKDKDKDKG